MEKSHFLITWSLIKIVSSIKKKVGFVIFVKFMKSFMCGDNSDSNKQQQENSEIPW